MSSQYFKRAFSFLLTLIVWVGFAPHAWAEEKAATKEGSTQNLEAKAEKGDLESQFRLGVHHLIGLTGKEDIAGAIKWFRKAADQGHVSSQKKLGNIYLFGEVVPKDEAEGLKWYRKAAE
jgi:TPR repeat protein